ncbi:MAG TPA: VWA domain-containing protein [Gammaproteobacteria bacterium]|nr:VWA domain-containing protein [Gammaproteobacteria bacterium]
MSAPPLTAEQLEEELDRRLDDPEFPGVVRHRPVTEPAAGLAALDGDAQALLLDWVGRLASVHEQLGYQFALRAPDELAARGRDGLEAWLCAVMDRFDRTGLYPAMRLLKGLDEAAVAACGPEAVALDAVSGMLTGFLGGLSGRGLRPVAGPRPWTDSESVFLPERIDRFPERTDNARLYKAMAAHLWAQVRFGSFPEGLAARLAALPDPDRALERYAALERLRLDACLARELPGLHRDLLALRTAAGDPEPAPPWDGFAERLAVPEAAAEDSLALLPEALAADPPPSACYAGAMDPQRLERVRARRVEQERERLQLVLRQILDGVLRRHGRQAAQEEEPEMRLERSDEALRLIVDGQPMEPPVEVQRLAESLELDLGELPPEALTPAGPGAYTGGDRDGEEEGKRPDLTDPATYYAEWDHRRQHYRADWCALREVAVPQRDPGFAARVLERYRPLVYRLRRSFEALRDEERRLYRQADGDEIDLDAAVEALADARHGLEADDRLFSRRQKDERDIAVLFMVDMSGSTKGWINEAEREALILLCDALERLGDRYGIYGFSGMTRNRCEIFPVKDLAEAYSPEVAARISGIEPKDYTRMGVAIRHLNRLLAQTPARTRLLVTLSDGKPDDLDGYYRGDYGIEDTRQALIEAKRRGIHPFCITIDEEGPGYLPHMYGAVNYTVVDRVDQLPRQVAEVYRKLTR